MISARNPWNRPGRLRRLLEHIRQNGGRVTPREVVRHGFGCRSTHDAKQLLTALVGDGLGKWYRGRSTPRGGRRRMIFVLNPKASEPACYSHTSSTFEASVRMAAMCADELRTLAWDLGQLLQEHHRLDPSVSAESLARLFAHFRRNIR
jgi:hypothetical protein